MPNLFEYQTRTAEQIEEALKTVLPAELPEVTNSDEDPLYRGLKVFAGIFEMLQYYIDRAAQESNIESAEFFSSIVRLARAEDYRVRGRKPFEVVLTFTLSSNAPTDVVIPQGTVVETVAGLQYTTITSATIIAGTTTVNVVAQQKQLFVNQNIGTTNGTPNQTIQISEKLVDSSVILNIGAEVYTGVDTFYYSLPNSANFIQTVNSDRVNEIILGDGVNGKLPITNQTILADYALTEGEDGRASAGELTEIVSNITLPNSYTISCTNLNDASGGRDIQTNSEIAKGLKALNRTVETAVSKETYISLGYLIDGVEKVGVQYDFGNTVDVYVIPTGGGLASPLLLSQVESFYNTRRMILTQVRANNAGEVKVILKIEVTLLPNGIRALVQQNIRNALTNFGSVANQDVTGAMVSGKIDQIVCNVAGVDTCIIETFSLKPYARPIATTQELNWVVELLAGSVSVDSWRIIFTSNIDFQLYKNDTFIGNYLINTLITLPEIKIFISQSYNTGDEWTFKTYPYLGNKAGVYQLSEPSILRIYDADITLNLIGGI